MASTATWRRVVSGGKKFSFTRQKRRKGTRHEFIRIQPEVKEAFHSGKPVVALETTILTHGMPYPWNIQTALAVEDIVRSHSVVPATIGVINGDVHVGLTHSQLEHLADPNEQKMKISRRDFPIACSKMLSGGTTVSGTLFVANSVGINVFVTGGMGGVHRHGNISFDISSDLIELARTPVGVVSSGIKSILDIPRTLELLETLGVAVVTYGSSKEFPAFFTPNSGCYVDTNLETPLDCARLLDTNINQESGSGVLIAVPVPVDVASECESVEEAIQIALAKAKDNNISGKEVTPFILDNVNKLTKGESLNANISLIKNNAAVGSQIALELARLQSSVPESTSQPSTVHVMSPNQATPTNLRPVVIGGSVVDTVVKVKTTPIASVGTNPGSVWNSFGGVARNIAEYLAKTDCQPLLVSTVGADNNGRNIIRNMKELNMSTKGVMMKDGVSTASYCAVLEESGELYCAVGDLSINDHLTIDWVRQFSGVGSSFMCFDANIPTSIMKYICDTFFDINVPIWFEPTCVKKSTRPMDLDGIIDKIKFTSPNLSELHAMHNKLVKEEEKAPPLHVTNINEIIDAVLSLSKPLLYNGVQHLLVTLGNHGLAHLTREEALLYPSMPSTWEPKPVVNVSGAGDCLVGGIISSIIKDCSMTDAINTGLLSAYYSLISSQTVEAPPNDETILKEWMNIKPKNIYK